MQLEIIKIKRTDQDDEKAVGKDYSDLLATYETKIHVSVPVYFTVSKHLWLQNYNQIHTFKFYF